MAVTKCKTTPDAIEGLAIVNNGILCSTYDNTQRTQHFTDIPGSGWMANLNNRFKYHGGEGGSGNWEH